MSFASEILADSPLGFWKVNEGTGTATDSTANAHNGTYSVTAPGTITGGQAALLAGITEAATLFTPSTGVAKVTIPDAAVFSGLTAFTMMGVAQVPTTGPGDLLTKELALTLGIGATLKPYVGGYFGGTFHNVLGASALVAGDKHLLHGTYDGATLTIYIDGSSVGSAAVTGTTATNTNPLRIAEWNDTTERFTSTLQYIAIYNTALSPTRISAHWTAASTPPATGGAPTLTLLGVG